MRGKPGSPTRIARGGRNIPAYAGKTSKSKPCTTNSQEHPRVCGENRFGLGIALFLGGTSPRMRGKLRYWSASRVLLRNIPAYAGKTECPDITQDWSEEHPRVCGENLSLGRMARVWAGTSPRMRGKRGRTLTDTIAARNIPAYAGKTLVANGKELCVTEHPRVCGENKGPSRAIGGAIRNIPAYAGKTDRDRGWCAVRWEHPRVCGENQRRLSCFMVVVGTSPRMRGKQYLPRSM